MRLSILASALAIATQVHAKGPFLKTVGPEEHIIGNDIWNVTIGRQYGTKLFYKNRDIVGDAVGHYASYNGAASDLSWTTVSIHKQTKDFLDISFEASEGELHWVIQPELAGAYQYFVNRALPVLGEFRTLWRLDNTTFFNGHTSIKDEALPTSADIAAATKVQDETWVKEDGTFITKYDWQALIRDQEYYGVYGPGFGSWYINAGKDEYNGDHLKQELMVHRETATGDVVQLNMLHGTHFMASASDAFPVGKVWGPWLWYLNDGSSSDASRKAKKEIATYPYPWFDNAAYQSRGSVSGKLILSDGRPAAKAAVFLGDNHPNETTLDMGRYYYYTAYTDKAGNFEFKNVRTASYALQAWANGGAIGDVSTTFIKNDVVVAEKKATNLGHLTWKTQERRQIFQIGSFDRTSLGFAYGGAPHEHALVVNCPANLTYTVGTSHTSDWCFGQSAKGNWTVKFNVPKLPNDSSAVLSVSLAGYSSGVSSSIVVNGAATVGNLTSANILTDPCMYRSGTLAGEWHYYEFPVGNGVLKRGWNTLDFQVTRTTLWHGFMWDAVALEYA
ncbi:hypothetical protein V502_05950 [Pseudogymnoascus sp. VKM F-4520 (FW-2644)]|nr:hypothetical protein V502_05950 [Pseudogymnoascus sp. VKM F-4520 (FW-2644)]